jgi:predicted DNA-binding transcriptional regulator YafY
MSVRQIHDALREVDERDHECNQRTIFRDLEHLDLAGYPLFQDDDGRWHVLSFGKGGYSVPVVPSELLALLLSEELLAPMRSAEVAGALAGLRQKIAAMLEPERRASAERIKNHLVTTFVGPGDYADGSVVPVIEKAIRLRKRLRIGYWSPGKKNGVRPRDQVAGRPADMPSMPDIPDIEDIIEDPVDLDDSEIAAQDADSHPGETTARCVDPYLLWYADARLYLVGHCHLRGAVRTFLVDRIRRIEILDEPFDVDPSFDARKFTGSGMGAWSGERHHVELWFSPAVAHLASERRFHPSQQVERDGDGARVTMEVAGLPHVAAWVASFGGQIVARGPEPLVQRIRDIHRHGLAAHGDPQSAD